MLIERERDALLSRWRQQVRALRSARHLDAPTLNDHLPRRKQGRPGLDRNIIGAMNMLHDFLSSNREELIRRCRSKVSRRHSPPVTPAELEHGVALFLEQLVWALRCEQESPGLDRDRIFGPLSKTPAAVEGSRTAALHGKALLDDGYSADQVVHDYGDICQAITELAQEKNASVTIDEFRTFNRLLDNAIADAVSSYGLHRDAAISAQGEQDQREWRGTLGDEQRQLIGLRGATGALLEGSLARLRDLIDRSLPPKP